MLRTTQVAFLVAFSISISEQDIETENGRNYSDGKIVHFTMRLLV